MKILFLYDLSAKEGTIVDHIKSLKKFSKHEIIDVNFRGDIPFFVDLQIFDAIIIHYSVIACNKNYISPKTRTQLREFKNLKAIFIQDEYRFINQTVDALAYMKINIIFTVVSEGVVETIYPQTKLPGVKKVTLLTGYVPDNLLKLPVPSFKDRKIDIAYRGRKLPFWLGKFGQEKWIIGKYIKSEIEKSGLTLKCDIEWEENKRIYSHEWINFLTSTKAVLGVESGASVCDFTGQIKQDVENYLKVHPHTDFETISQKFLTEIDGKYEIKTISPRCFEAAALKTLMILYEGSYSGILKAWQHYVPLKKNHSNITEIFDMFNKPELAQEIIDRCYSEIACNPNYSYEFMVRQIDNLLSQEQKTEVLSRQNNLTAFWERKTQLFFSLSRYKYLIKCKYLNKISKLIRIIKYKLFMYVRV